MPSTAAVAVTSTGSWPRDEKQKEGDAEYAGGSGTAEEEASERKSGLQPHKKMKQARRGEGPPVREYVDEEARKGRKAAASPRRKKK